MIQPEETIVITGAAGFIASYLASFLNQRNVHRLILVDDFSREDKRPNWSGKQCLACVERDEFFDWLDDHPYPIRGVFHLGARTDTTEMDYEVHRKWNLVYSQRVWQYCASKRIPLVYASSAATYGSGTLGYKDSHALAPSLQPLNPYGQSKNEFDVWALQQEVAPPFWAGVKFFNVYGPNEYHKGRMASVIYHAYHQIQSRGVVRLFRSHHPDFQDGEQKRDFIYVKDICQLILWFMEEQPASGLYNAGSGEARTFNDLIVALFEALERSTAIEYIETPADIRDKYQYFTEADMNKVKEAGYPYSFTSLEAGIRDYVTNYLSANVYF